MESVIKFEVDQISTKSLCHGCLSQDRKLTLLSGENCKLYYSLIGSGTLNGSEERVICWECEAILRRVRKFQNQILQAQSTLEVFYNMCPKVETLSNLSIFNKDHYDLHYEFIEQMYIENEFDIKPTEYSTQETILKSEVTAEQPSTKNSSINVNKIKIELEIRDNSDYEGDYDSSNNVEISHESTSKNEQINNTESKKESYEHYIEISHESTSKNEEIKNTEIKKESKKQTKNKNAIKNSVKKYMDHEFSKGQKVKYLKYVTVKDITTKFKKATAYFEQEALDLEQIEEYNAKLGKNPCGDRCRQCRFNERHDFLLLLRQNFKEITSDSPTTCLLCEKKMPDLDNLRTHLKYKHCTFWKCSLCNFYCRFERRVRHLNEQHTKVYSCNKCQVDFTSKRHFFLHFKSLHDTFACHHCNILFKGSRSRMITHQLIHADKHVCKICNKSYKGRRYLKTHIKTYHPETLNKKVDKEAAYCVECNKQFKSVELFKRHLFDSPKHTPKPTGSIPCPECGKIFTRKSYMTNHFNKEHMTERARYKCTVCEKYYTNSSALKRHYQDVHLKVPREKNKICDICGRGFYTNRILANHRRTHTGERPYSCDYCSATFTQQTPMITHKRKCSFQRNY